MTGPAAAARGTALGRVLPVLAVGEYVVDKLPNVPARTIAPSLAVRIIGGAIAGGTVALGSRTDRILGALLGAVGAAGGAYAGTAYRRAVGSRVPPVVAALLEDGAAITLARASSRSRNE